ncbi:hypothetical protein ACIBO9_28420 [Streptomyces prunicolor]|uniref:hypothetical protein n=1 Tax=Streptomyces prunicolor TaxID=67348 RepID=UPI0037CF83E8
MPDTFTRFFRPAAQGSYDAYLAHIQQCRQCPRGPERCADGQELVRLYLADVRKS